MNRSKGSKLSLWILGGVTTGACLGYFFPDLMLATEFIGQFFIGALGLIIVPLLISTLIGRVSELGDLKKIGRVGSRVFAYFLGTSVVAVIIGLVSVLLLKPGSSVSPVSISSQAVTSWPESIEKMLEGVLSNNLVTSISAGQYLGLTLLFIIIGSLLYSHGIKGRSITTFCREMITVLTDVVSLLLNLAPIGFLFLTGAAIAKDTGLFTDTGRSLGLFIITVLTALAVYGLIILPLVLRFFGSESPYKFIGKLFPAILTGFATASSAATYPVTYECLSKTETDNRSASFVLPLGMTLNAGGSAIFLVIAMLFLCQMSGITLGFMQVLSIAGISLLASFCLGGLPSTALFVLPMLIATLGLDLSVTAGLGMIVAVDWFLDRGRTVVNVWSDAVGAVVLANSYEFKTARHGLKQRGSIKTSTPISKPTKRASKRGDSTRSDRSDRRDRRDVRRNEDRFRNNEKTLSRAGRRDNSASYTRESRPERRRTLEKSGTSRTKTSHESSSSPFDLTATTSPTIPTIGMPETHANEKRSTNGVSRATGEVIKTAHSVNKKEERTPRKTVQTKEKRTSRSSRQSSATSNNIQTPVAESIKIDKEVESNGRTDYSKPKLNPEIIARELASVSAHLELKNGEKKPDIINNLQETPEQSEIEFLKKPESIPTIETIPEQRELSEVVLLESDINSNMNRDTDSNENESRSKKPVVNDSPATPKFGRSVSKRGSALNKNTGVKKQTPVPEADSPVTTSKTESYSTDGAEFGRGKKKKVR